MTLDEFIMATTYIDSYTQQQVNRPMLRCKDGYEVSIQAGERWYCIPKKDGQMAYETFELGFPNRVDELIMGHVEDPDRPLDTVYFHVPHDVVSKLIEKHGGIDYDYLKKSVNGYRERLPFFGLVLELYEATFWKTMKS